MLPSGRNSLLQTVPLSVLMIGFQEVDISPLCLSVLASIEPKPSVDWVMTVEKSLVQIKSENHYDVVVFDCRKERGKWKQVSQIPQDGQKTVIMGIVTGAEVDGVEGKILEDVVGYRVDETIAPLALKWSLQQAQERKQFLAEQEQLRGRLDEAAYKVEMADVASTVLHNVGNVLTSVTVAVNIVESVVDQSSVTLVNRMAELMKTHNDDLGTYLTEDPKGKRIPLSLEKLGIHLLEEQQSVSKEIQGLVRNVRHMKQIIASHQTMAKSAGKVEHIALGDVLSHAMELSFQPGDAEWMSIHREYHEVPTVSVDHHQLLQVLVNLLRNAKQAMRQRAQAKHELTLHVQYQDADRPSVVMTIQDDGIGIAPEHLSKMFTRGFTTKKDGNGIGLHSSIMAIQNMGGSMHVHSDGVGKGAKFTLTFPVQKEEVSA
jgi:signal transduction histidine kinase